MMLRPASLPWFARHELGLFWRDWTGMMTAGRRTRGVVLASVLVVATLLLHLLANALVGPWLAAGVRPDKPTLVLLTGGGLLFWTVMLSQALESVTRAYYARADLDLILSSPASAQRLFAVRTAAIAITTILLSGLLAAPVVDVLVWHDGPKWFAVYGVLLAFGALATGIGIGITIALFHLVGAKRTRLISQIVAAVIGAGFIIGIQAAAILSYGSMNRFAVLQSADVVARAPDPDSPIWLPARAAMGDLGALAIVMVLGLGALALAILTSASSFSQFAIATAGISRARVRHAPSRTRFRTASQKQVLRHKEWTLLRRDPWLLSQTLMQVLYLLPPALLLWINFGRSAGAAIVVVPVLVMAAGQLAGGLAWLALSGEDAFDLVQTAPIRQGTVLLAKIEAIMVVIAIIVAPLLLLTALLSPDIALITAGGVALSAASATAIQMWFRAQARRSMFRRRQVSSRAATLSEAFASIMWAAAAAVLAAGSWILALAPAVLALLVLLLAWAIRPSSPEPAQKPRRGAARSAPAAPLQRPQGKPAH
ncbi:MAG: permease [Devosia sp.]|nr:permease [Devosia sp.]